MDELKTPGVGFSFTILFNGQHLLGVFISCCKELWRKEPDWDIWDFRFSFLCCELENILAMKADTT